jgi:SAM-dependent methyltransferase
VGEPLGEVYEAMAREYEAHAADSPYNAHYDRPALLELAGEVAGLRVLDAGCGPGYYAHELLERGAEVVGFDASRTMVELARHRVGDRAAIHQLRLDEPLPFADGAFDLVLCALALHYVDDRAACLRELRRVLRPAGAMVLSTQHPTSDWLAAGGSYFDVVVERDTWTGTRSDWEVSYWREPLTSLCDAVHRAGFLIERLVEPLPQPSMRERWPDRDARLRREPGFLQLRLLPAPEPSVG